MESGIYIELWAARRPEIQRALESPNQEEVISLDRAAFDAVGNRKDYSFRLEMNQGEPSNNIGGSAVARDLAHVLCSSRAVMPIFRRGDYTFVMGKEFRLKITATAD